MCERWDFRRGFSIYWSRHKIDLKITRKARGVLMFGSCHGVLQGPVQAARAGGGMQQG
jgi:hypothetical protein